METAHNHFVHTFHYRRGEQVQMALREYKGKRYLDLRIWFQSKNADAYRPSRKGISLNLENLPQVQRGMDEIARAAQSLTVPKRQGQPYQPKNYQPG